LAQQRRSEQGQPKARRPAVAHRVALCAVAACQGVSSSRHPRREAAVCRDAAGARLAPRRQEASLQAPRPEGYLPGVWPLAVLLPRAVLRWGLRPAFPAGACERRRAAHPSDAYRPEQALQLAQARWLPPEAGAVVSGAAAAPQQAEAAEVESDVVVQPPEVAAALDVAVPQREVAAAVLDAAAVLLRGAELDVAAVPQQAVAEVWGAAAELRWAAGSDVAEPRRAVLVASAQRPAAGPSAAPSVFRRGRLLPWPARRRAARSAHAMRMPRAASRSKRSWQAARCEGLSWCFRSLEEGW
jgi:hypothetical protein